MPIKKSVQHDFIVCLEDGKKLKMLKRHLATRYNMTPEDYRRRWGLPTDYPMVAPAYATQRSQLAKQIGLGRKPAAPVASEPLPPRRPRHGVLRAAGSLPERNVRTSCSVAGPVGLAAGMARIVPHQ